MTSKWTNSTLGELSIGGRGYYGIGASAVPYSTELYTYLRITDINDDGTLNMSDLKSVADEKAGDYLLKPNDIVFARTGASTGRNYFYDEIDGEFVFAGFLIKFSLDPEKVNPRYIKYHCLSKEYRDWIAAFNTGSTRGNINAQTLASMPITLPDRAIQDRIVQVLDALEEKRKSNTKINDNLQQQAQAIYHSLFVSFDGISANQLYETELGLIPAGWTVKPLSEVTTSIRAKVKANDYKVLSAINTGQLQLSEEYFNKQVFSKNISNYIVVEPYDFAYNPARINIGSIGMNNFGFTGCVSPVYVVVRTEPNYHYFLDFFVKTKRFSEEVKTRSSGSVRQSLSYADFGQIKIAYPPAEVVEQFNCEYVARLKIIEHLKAENEKLASLRDSLLPKLMSGEIDVSDIQL